VNTARLQDVPLFARLAKRDMEVLGRIADELDVEAGRTLARQGDVGREFFVIESGRAEVTRDGKHVADLGPGDFFGEIALLEDDRRTATVTASGPMTLIAMTGSDFRGLRQTMPSVYETVRDEIRRRRPVPA
jgi:CRP/FNR family transcriptional regulator, cyclic AMP receptor protein